jgi:hypothetical protein
MTTHALAMPDYVAQLIRMPLARMGMEPSEVQDDIIMCPLLYEDGTVLSLVTMCIGKPGWFKRVKPMLAVSIVTLDDKTRVVRVYSSETIAVPTGPIDLQFMLRFVAMVRASAWTVGTSGDMGECISVSERAPAQG